MGNAAVRCLIVASSGLCLLATRPSPSVAQSPEHREAGDQLSAPSPPGTLPPPPPGGYRDFPSFSSLSSAPGRELPVALDVLVGTNIPTTVGLEGTAEWPGGLLTQMHVGFMPAGYLSFINNTAVGFEWYDEATAAVIEDAIDGSFVLRLAVGWRPATRSGLELLAGYSLMTAGGGTSAADLIEQASGLNVRGAGGELDVSTTLHAFHAHMGWRFVIDRFVFRIAFGWVHTLAASTSIGGADAEALGPRIDNALREAETFLDEDVFEKYGFAPELQLMAGFRL